MRVTAILLSLVSLPTIRAASNALWLASEDSLDLDSDLDSDAEIEERPVMKVVQLLQDMRKELDADLEDDKKVHQELDCWCETNEKDKTQAIENGEQSILELKAFLDEARGKIAEIKVRRKETKEELESNIKALSAATAIRMKESKAFAKDDSDTVVAIKACKDAITVLSKHNAGLLEVRAAAETLQNAHVLQMGLLVSNNLRSAGLKDFLHDAHAATSFLAIPGFKSYGSQSGPIFGILQQMLDDFEEHLSEIESQEEKAEKDFKELKAAKEDEISGGKKTIIDLDKRLGILGEKQAQATKDLEDTEKQVSDDTTFLGNLRKKCSESDEDFNTRVKDRLEELSAVQKAIDFLNDEDSFKLFDKTFPESFLQLSAANTEKVSRQSAAATLERAAAVTKSPWLALMAGRVQLDAFTEVKKSIQGMIAELAKQQKDEEDHKDWCVEETNQNTQDADAANSKKDTLSAKVEDLKKGIAVIQKDIDDTKDEIAETQKQMKRASQTREAANADSQQTITDQRMTQMVLIKALTSLRVVYSLIQQRAEEDFALSHRRHRNPGAPLIRLSGTDTQPGTGPAKFKTYSKNSGGSQVVTMIENIIAESKKTEAAALKAEEDAQTTYETFMTGSNKAISAASAKILTLSGNRAGAKEDLLISTKDLTAVSKKITSLADELDDLKASCDFITKNFSNRQEARAAESDALKEALSILSGAK